MDVTELRPSDFRTAPIWEFVTDDETNKGETAVQPVRKLPVNTLTGRIVGTEVSLANGTKMFAMIGNVDLADPVATKHFLGLSVFKNGVWRHLARYHDPDYLENGPEGFARCLGLRVEEVFPIAFDLREVAAGHPDSLAGYVASTPSEILSREERMKLILRSV